MNTNYLTANWLLRLLGLLFLAASFFLPGPVSADSPKALWDANGKVINNTPGNTVQQNPKIISDSQGNYDLYAQKLDSSGKKLWLSSGVVVCRHFGNQNSAQIISDGNGGAIIVWQDYRDKNADIFVQHLDSQGQAVWGEAGKAVCQLAEGQFAPQLITDNNGGAIITWHDYRSKIGEDIYAQRIDSSGQALWLENGQAVCTVNGTQWYPKIVTDGLDGAIIVWTDGRISPADNNIYAQRLDPKGNSLWQKDGVSLCQAKQNQEYPAVIASDGGAIVVWTDSRFNNADIFGQKIDLNGQSLWQKDGVEVCAFNYDQEHPRLSSDGAGGAVVAWQDQRGTETAIYAQKLSATGQNEWQEDGRQISQFGNNHQDLIISKLTGEDWVVVWEETRNNQNSLLAQKINSSGIPLWSSGGMALTQPNYSQKTAAVAAGSKGEIIVAWQDKRFGQDDIYGQKISSDGTLLWSKGGQEICRTQGAVTQQNIQTVLTQNQGVVLAFEDARAGFFNIYLQKVGTKGELLWGQNALPVDKIAANQANPSLVSDGKSGIIVVWEDQRDKKYSSIRAQHFNAQGEKLWPSSLVLAKFNSRQVNPIMVADETGGAIVAWQENRDVLSLQDIYAQRISASGKLLWGGKGKTIISENGDQTDLTMIPDSQGGAIIAWTDYRHGDRNPDIYAQRVNSQGKLLWPDKTGIAVCSAPDIQRNPKLTGDEEGGAIIAWTDRGGGSYDIYAQRVDQKGKTLWLRDGIPINQLSRTQQNPKFGTDSIVVWEDYRFGNWDIFAGSINKSGKLLWGEMGSNIAVIPQTQYAPQIAKWKDEQVIVVWEDYRSGQQYEIYIQKLNSSGQPLWTENGFRVNTSNGARFPQLITIPTNNTFYVFWEDFTDGNRAIFGQKFSSN